MLVYVLICIISKWVSGVFTDFYYEMSLSADVLASRDKWISFVHCHTVDIFVQTVLYGMSKSPVLYSDYLYLTAESFTFSKLLPREAVLQSLHSAVQHFVSVDIKDPAGASYQTFFIAFLALFWL